MSIRAHRYGDNAVLIDCEPDEVLGWSVTARQVAPEAVDVVAGACTVLIDGVDVAATLAKLSDARPADAVATGELVEVSIVYDGADLAAVARLWDCSVSEVIGTHRSCEFVVAFCGFTPGFAYLLGLPEELAVPRLASPRSRVPAGSVGLAGRYCGLYPGSSPGGWQLIGHTDAALWRPEAPTPALLTPGSRVRFVDA